MSNHSRPGDPGKQGVLERSPRRRSGQAAGLGPKWADVAAPNSRGTENAGSIGIDHFPNPVYGRPVTVTPQCKRVTLSMANVSLRRLMCAGAPASLLTLQDRGAGAGAGWRSHTTRVTNELLDSPCPCRASRTAGASDRRRHDNRTIRACTASETGLHHSSARAARRPTPRHAGATHYPFDDAVVLTTGGDAVGGQDLAGYPRCGGTRRGSSIRQDHGGTKPNDSYQWRAPVSRHEQLSRNLVWQENSTTVHANFLRFTLQRLARRRYCQSRRRFDGHQHRLAVGGEGQLYGEWPVVGRPSAPRRRPGVDQLKAASIKSA